MDWTPIIVEATKVLAPLLLAALGYLSIKVTQLINAKIKNEYVKAALERLNTGVLEAVKAQQAMTVAAMKEAAKDGKITTEEAIRIRDDVIANAKAYVGTHGLVELQKVIDPVELEKMIRTKLEANVHDLRIATDNGQTIPPPPSS